MKKCVLEKQITFEDYVKCLRDINEIVKTQYTFQSKLHNILTIAQDKVALSPFDDKRYILENNIDTLPWGHYKLKDLTASKIMVKKNPKQQNNVEKVAEVNNFNVEMN